MAMKILIADDDHTFTRVCLDTLRQRFPGARIDIVVSVGGYFNHFWDTDYDICIMRDRLYEGDNRSAFRNIAPLLKQRFPETEILCNAEGTREAENAEKLAGMKLFARGPDGRIPAFGRQVCTLMAYMRSMVLPRSERMSIAPARISVAPAAGSQQPATSRPIPRPREGPDGTRSLGARRHDSMPPAALLVKK
ncbi:MAG: hypothetical protein AB1657_02820 [Candidatus Micrarchaeota archaeon]